MRSASLYLQEQRASLKTSSSVNGNASCSAFASIIMISCGDGPSARRTPKATAQRDSVGSGVLVLCVLNYSASFEYSLALRSGDVITYGIALYGMADRRGGLAARCAPHRLILHRFACLVNTLLFNPTGERDTDWQSRDISH